MAAENAVGGHRTYKQNRPPFVPVSHREIVKISLPEKGRTT
jgi:hypothetical protein